MAKNKKKDIVDDENIEEVVEEVSEAEAHQAEIDALKVELEETKSNALRAIAESENYKKRIQREMEMSMKYRIQSFATTILPALDNLERALESANDDDPMKQGVQMIYEQIVDALKSEGVSEIDALDLPYDANFHQAFMTEKVEGVEPNTVLAVLQKGYLLKDRILRPSYVKVSE